MTKGFKKCQTQENSKHDDYNYNKLSFQKLLEHTLGRTTDYKKEGIFCAPLNHRAPYTDRQINGGAKRMCRIPAAGRPRAEFLVRPLQFNYFVLRAYFDESGFVIFCQTPKKIIKKVQVLRIFFVSVIQSTTGSYHCCSRASDLRMCTSHPSGYRD